MAVIAMLTSCGIYGKYTEKTADDVPQNLFGFETSASDTASCLGNLSWRHLFDDPQLQELIDSCLAHNVDMQTAHLHVDEANAGLTAAKLSYLPSLAFTPNGALTKYGLYDSTGKVYQIPVTAQWQIDAFGLLRNQHLQTEATRDMMLDAEQATQTGLIGGVANIYYTLAMLDAQIQIAKETEQTWKKSVETMKALKAAGMSNQAAVSQMEAAWYGVQNQIIELEHSRDEVLDALTLLMNEPTGTRRDLHPLLSSFHYADQTLSVGIPCQLLHNRPDVRVAENQLRAACYADKAATSAFFPQITITGLFGWTNTDGSNIINPAFTIAQLVGSLAQPIFARGQLRAQKIAARDELQIAEMNFSHKLLEAGTEVSDYLKEVEKARQESVVYDQQVAALQKAYDATRLTMEYGNTTYLEVLTAQQSLLQAQLGRVANDCALVQAVINLYTSLGGGSK